MSQKVREQARDFVWLPYLPWFLFWYSQKSTLWIRVWIPLRHLRDRVENSLFPFFFPICLVFKNPPIRENFPSYPFLNGLLPLAQLHPMGVPTCARDLEKKEIPFFHQDGSGSQSLRTPVLKALKAIQFAAGCQQCLHAIFVHEWIPGKSASQAYDKYFEAV